MKRSTPSAFSSRSHLASPTMGNSDLQAYLASKYMSGAKADAILERSSSDPNSKRRKKRKLAPEPTSTSAVASSGFKVADEDDSAWTRVGQGDEDDDEFKPGTSSTRFLRDTAC